MSQGAPTEIPPAVDAAQDQTAEHFSWLWQANLPAVDLGGAAVALSLGGYHACALLVRGVGGFRVGWNRDAGRETGRATWYDAVCLRAMDATRDAAARESLCSQLLPGGSDLCAWDAGLRILQVLGPQPVRAARSWRHQPSRRRAGRDGGKFPITRMTIHVHESGRPHRNTPSSRRSSGSDS